MAAAYFLKLAVIYDAETKFYLTREQGYLPSGLALELVSELGGKKVLEPGRQESIHSFLHHSHYRCEPPPEVLKSLFFDGNSLVRLALRTSREDLAHVTHT